jgi:hypothetical protein
LAETAVPFTNKHAAATRHLERVELIYLKAYGPQSEWLMGVGDQKGADEAYARKAEIEKYYAQAKQLAGVEP